MVVDPREEINNFAFCELSKTMVIVLGDGDEVFDSVVDIYF